MIYDRLYYWVLLGWLSNHIDHLFDLHIVAALSRQQFLELNILSLSIDMTLVSRAS